MTEQTSADWKKAYNKLGAFAVIGMTVEFLVGLLSAATNPRAEHAIQVTIIVATALVARGFMLYKQVSHHRMYWSRFENITPRWLTALTCVLQAVYILMIASLSYAYVLINGSGILQWFVASYALMVVVGHLLIAALSGRALGD